jgi:hypothetical protein
MLKAIFGILSHDFFGYPIEKPETIPTHCNVCGRDMRRSEQVVRADPSTDKPIRKWVRIQCPTIDDWDLNDPEYTYRGGHTHHQWYEDCV